VAWSRVHRDGLPRNVVVPLVSTHWWVESEEVALGTHQRAVDVRALDVDLRRVVVAAQEPVVALSEPLAQLIVPRLPGLDIRDQQVSNLPSSNWMSASNRKFRTS
jgi:hypothetical protein